MPASARPRIVLAAIGSRGDVQPMLALGQALRQRGHRVLVAAPPDFADWVQALGFEFAAVGLHMQNFLRDHPDVLSGSMRKAGPIQRRYFASEIEIHVNTLLAICADADVLVWAGLALGAPSVAQKLGIPALGVLYTSCLIPSDQHPPPVFPRQDLPHWINRVLWKINDWLAIGAVGKPLNRSRAAIGLAAVNLREHLMHQCQYALAVDAGVFPGDPGWPATIQHFNFLFFDDPQPLDAELDAWLRDGEPPVYVGFGSMTGPGTARIDAMLQQALRNCGRRCLIGAGWGQLGGGSLPAHWRSVGGAPHAQLFPRVAVVVHHGGSGTTANALRAGVPQVVMPLILDQYHHAYRLYQAGLAPRPVAMEAISAAQLSRAIQSALELPAAPRQAAASRLCASDATHTLAAHIEGLVQAAGRSSV